MNFHESTCRDAAFEVLLEQELTEQRRGEQVPAADVRLPAPGGRRAATVLAAAAGVLVVAATAWLQSQPTNLAQDPVRQPRKIALEGADHLRRIADQVQGANARYVQVVTMVFPLGAIRGRQVDYVEVPDTRLPIEDGSQLARDLADAFARPRDSSASHHDALLDLHLPIGDGRYVHVRCHRNGKQVSVSNVGLGFRHVDGALAKQIRGWMEAATDRASATFVFAEAGEALREAPASVTQLLGYGVDDQDLREAKRMPGLRRVKLVGRHTDEYPQQYQGVSLSTDGLTHLAGTPITHLHLESAVLDDRALAIVAGLAELRELTIEDGRRCTFTERGIGLLANLPRLQRIEIEDCDGFDDACAKALARSRTLAKVRLKECHTIGGTGTGALFAAPNLTELELVSVDVEGAAKAARSQSLRELRLTGCTGRFRDFGGLPQLRRLRLHEMSLDENAIASLQKASLRELTVSRCPTVTTHLPDIAAMPHLESLAISGARSGADWPTTFAVLRDAEKLRRLSLIQNGLTDDDALHLRHLTRLERLDLRINKVSRRRAEQLRTWLGSTVVHVEVLPGSGK